MNTKHNRDRAALLDGSAKLTPDVVDQLVHLSQEDYEERQRNLRKRAALERRAAQLAMARRSSEHLRIRNHAAVSNGAMVDELKRVGLVQERRTHDCNV